MTPTEILLTYIARDVLNRPGLELNEDTSLVSSGLVDSLSLVTLLAKLEEVTARRIPAGRVRPRDLETVRTMLATAERVGRPR